MARKDKTSVPVKLPPEFVEFMQDAASAIENRDDSAMTESDDLIQCDVAYGGLHDATKMQYGFTYFPTEDGDITWEFDLSRDEVLEIAAGEIVEVRLWSCQDDECKSLHSSKDAYCSNCDNVLDYVDEEAEFRKSYPKASTGEIRRLTNMRRIVFAIIDYHKANGHFPAPYTQDDEGRRLHSWRTLILPHLDEQALFGRIDFSKAWSSDENRKLWNAMPQVFRTIDKDKSDTEFVAVVGDSTIWPESVQRSFDDIRSGYSHTIAVVAYPVSRMCWMSPNDTNVEELVDDCQVRRDSFVAGFCDGHATTFADLPQDALERLLTI